MLFSVSYFACWRSSTASQLVFTLVYADAHLVVTSWLRLIANVDSATSSPSPLLSLWCLLCFVLVAWPHRFPILSTETMVLLVVVAAEGATPIAPSSPAAAVCKNLHPSPNRQLPDLKNLHADLTDDGGGACVWAPPPCARGVRRGGMAVEGEGRVGKFDAQSNFLCRGYCG